MADFPVDKRLIFTVTTGRSGTRYLARALGTFRRVHAEHEPHPTFSSAMRTVASAPHTAAEFWRRRKLPRIARTKKPIYAETSHLVCKGFLESLIELGGRPTLVHLFRPEREVAGSLWKLDTVPGRTFKGVKYYLSPADACFLPPGGDPGFDVSGWHDYQMCYWYALEIAERARVYVKRFAPLGVELHRVDLAELRDHAGVEALGARLDLGPRHSLARLAPAGGKHRNAKSAKKLDRSLPDERLDELEAEVQAAVASPRSTPSCAITQPTVHAALR
jgi:hypothetical protein